MSKKDRDEALERVGRALYGDLWIGELKTRDWDIGRHDKSLTAATALPPSPKEAGAIAKARFRSLASDLQYGQVFRWLHDCGINCTTFTFDTAKFEKWFSETFGDQFSSPTDKRKAAILGLLEAGHRPGRGGTPWKKFKKQVQEETGLEFDLKTLRRDVRELLPLVSGKLDISDISAPG